MVQKSLSTILWRNVLRVLECQQLLSNLGNSQVELHLLRSCLSLCKINHLIRTVPSDVIGSQLSRFDAGLRSSLESVIHSSVPDLSWKQATLPVRLGGWAFVNQQEQHRHLSLQAVTRHVSWSFNYCLERNSLPSSPAHLLTKVSASKAGQL